MNSMHAARTATAIAVFAMLGGCASWHGMDKPQGTAAGAVGGAVAGAVVAGPVGAVVGGVGGVGGAYVGHETTGKTGTVTTTTRSITPQSYDATTIRSVQQALNERGYNAGAADGQWGLATKDALIRFQQVSGLPANGELGRSTLDALGVS